MALFAGKFRVLAACITARIVTFVPVGTSRFHAASSLLRKAATAASSFAGTSLDTSPTGLLEMDVVDGIELCSSQSDKGKKSKSPKIESRSASEMTPGLLSDSMIFRAGLFLDKLLVVEVASWPESTRARIMQCGDERPFRSNSSKSRFRGVSMHGIDT